MADEKQSKAQRPLLTEDGRLTRGRLAGRTMNGAIWVLAWPVIIESYLNSLVGLTDTMLASQLSEAATDAIGVASYFVWFISLITMALSTGATAMVSRSVGKHRIATANAAVGQTFVLAIVSGVVVGSAMAAAAPLISTLVNLEGEAKEAFVGYLRIAASGVPMSSVLFSGIACLRGAGDSLRPLWAMAACNVVNIVVSFVLAGVPLRTSQLIDGETVTRTVVPAVVENGLGIYGIAIGTLAAHTVGAIIITIMLIVGRGGVTLKRRRMLPHWVTMRRLVRLGFPNFLESLGMWLGNFVIVMFVGWLPVASRANPGETSTEGLFGAHIWAIRIEAVSFLPGFAMGMAAATLAGQYLGAGSPKLARAAIFRCTAIGAGVMFLMGVAFVTVAEQIFCLFTAQESHLRLVPPLLIACGLVQVPFGVALVIRSALRGAGDVTVVMWITWIATYAVRLPLAFFISGADVYALDGETMLLENPSPFDYGLTGLWIGLSIELAIRGFLFAGRFLHGGWTTVRV